MKYPILMCIVLIIAIAIIGFISKSMTVSRDREKGVRRIRFPFVGQVSFALLAWIGSFLTTFKLVSMGVNAYLSDWGIDNGLTIVGSLTIWFFWMAFMYKLFFVSVPGFVGLVTESVIGGEYFTYSTGIHIKYPWEIARKENYFSLELITVPFIGDFVSHDNGVVSVNGSFRYRADFNNLIKYAQIDESTIVIGFSNLVKELVTSEIAKRTAVEAIRETQEIKEAIEKLYIETDGEPKRTAKDEKSFGVQFEDFTLAKVVYNDETQKIQTTVFKMDALAKPTHFHELDQRAKEDAMVMGGNVTKKITKIDIAGLEGLGAAVVETLLNKDKDKKKKGGNK